MQRPTVVCLCGSTRFMDVFEEATIRETLAGKIVLSVGCNLRADHEFWSDKTPEETDALKARLDALHLRKIDMADEVLVLNVDGYIGDSTRREIAYAVSLGRHVHFWDWEKYPGDLMQALNAGRDAVRFEGLDSIIGGKLNINWAGSPTR